MCGDIYNMKPKRTLNAITIKKIATNEMLMTELLEDMGLG
jgi:hypothetical protein